MPVNQTDSELPILDSTSILTRAALRVAKIMKRLEPRAVFELAANTVTRAGSVQIVQASTSEEIAIVRTLFIEYAAWLAIDLSFQNFEEELANLLETTLLRMVACCWR